jgi:SAM-dependent methyltransferase
MDYAEVTACRACGSAELGRVLDLGRQPLANSYVREPAELPTYPLELLICRRCFLGQLSMVVRPDLMFREYLYVSGVSRTFREHFDGLAGRALEWVAARPAQVLDLACNDGTLLEAFRRRGAVVRGVDPAGNLVALAQGKGLEVVEGYWPQARSSASGPFDIITACNVLAHVAEPREFLRAALESLAPGGAVVVEFPYCRSMVLNREWDTIYHEHLSYFLMGPILRLADGLGAAVIRAELVPIHGGSLRLALQPSRGGHCAEAQRLAESESRDGLNELATYHAFAGAVEETCGSLLRVVGDQATAGRRVIGFGASAKGNTLLNCAGLSLDYIVDDSPLKHGYLTPGRNIPIRSPEALDREEKDLAVLLLAWNFAREIVAKVRARRPDRDDRVIHYVPRVCVHRIDEALPELSHG